MTPRLWTPEIVRPPMPVVDGALRRIRREERERFKHIRDPRVDSICERQCALSIDNQNNFGTPSADTTMSCNLVIAAGATCVFALVRHANTTSAQTVTCGGSAMTAISNTLSTYGVSSSQWFYRLAPGSGTKTIQANWTGAAFSLLYVISVLGGHTSAPAINGTVLSETITANHSLSITSASGDITIDYIFTSGVTLTSPTQTQQLLTGAENGVSTAAGTGSPIGHGWTHASASINHTGFDIVAGAGGGGGAALKRNSSLNGLGASGPFFHDPLSMPDRGIHAEAA